MQRASATERGHRDRDKIEWKLITDLQVNSRTEAIEKLNWYAVRSSRLSKNDAVNCFYQRAQYDPGIH